VPYSPAGTWPTDKFLGGGVLAEGQTVWLECPCEKESVETLVPAFVEHLGAIVVDARLLVDLGQHVTSSLQKWRGGSPVDQKEHYDYRSHRCLEAFRPHHFYFPLEKCTFVLSGLGADFERCSHEEKGCHSTLYTMPRRTDGSVGQRP
jgi:hypothetical protein